MATSSETTEWLAHLVNPDTRQAAAKALLAEPDCHTLIAGTRHREPAVRHGCYWVLHRCEGPGIYGVFPALLQGLQDRDPKVQNFVKSLMLQRLKQMPATQRLSLNQLTHPQLKALLEHMSELPALQEA
jgi:hypothetical protein